MKKKWEKDKKSNELLNPGSPDGSPTDSENEIYQRKAG
jgi:hypothetical protein